MIIILSYWTGWWFQPTPKNDGFRQLGWWHSQLNGKLKNVPNHQPVLLEWCYTYEDGNCSPHVWLLAMPAYAFSVHVPVDSVWGNSHPTILNGMKKHITGVYIYIYPPTPADARGSAPGHNTFDPFLNSSSSIAENSRSQTIEVKLDVKLWLSSRISEGTFRPPGSLLLPARN